MITNDQASAIANEWHSVITWSDPGVAMYSVTSTGKVHTERHRARLVAYIDAHLSYAAELDASEDSEPVVCESNVADLQALRAWALAFTVPCPDTLEDFGADLRIAREVRS